MRRNNSIERSTSFLPLAGRRTGTALLCVLAAALLLSCEDGADEAETFDFAIDESFERGPMTLSLRVDRDEITIAGTIHLVLEARVDEGYAIEMPKFGDKLEQFGIVDFRDPPQTLDGENRVVVSRMYTLEPFLSGEYIVPPMTVSFWKKDDAENRHQIETEEIAITVNSLLPEDHAELQIKEIAPPVGLPKESKAWLYGVCVLVVAAVAGIVVFLWWRRKRGEGLAETIPPHELAFSALEAVLAENLIEKGQYKQFYIKVSDVLRRFIENRFFLHAPERTTEEFLAELRASDVLATAHKALLRDFLEHCDLVKFAEHHPANDDIQQTFDTCKQFILETANDDGAANREGALTDAV